MRGMDTRSNRIARRRLGNAQAKRLAVRRLGSRTERCRQALGGPSSSRSSHPATWGPRKVPASWRRRRRSTPFRDFIRACLLLLSSVEWVEEPNFELSERP
jgi:hypothetical protein